MNTPHISHDATKEPTLLSSILAILGFIIIGFIVVWGIIHLVSLICGVDDPAILKNIVSAVETPATTTPAAPPATAVDTTAGQSIYDSVPTKKTPAKKHTVKTSIETPKIQTPADISVRILSTDFVDGSMAVRFDIANRGGKPTGSYTFEADIPTVDGYHYVSPIQSSLGGGDHVVNTLRFDSVAQDGGEFVVVVDADRSTSDVNRGNNTAQTFVNTF